MDEVKETLFRNSPNLSKNEGDGCPEGDKRQRWKFERILGIKQAVHA